MELESRASLSCVDRTLTEMVFLSLLHLKRKKSPDNVFLQLAVLRPDCVTL